MVSDAGLILQRCMRNACTNNLLASKEMQDLYFVKTKLKMMI